MSGKDKWVRRFSVDETAKHKDGFTIYKITSVLFPIASPEANTVVSVWKRWREVTSLHSVARRLAQERAPPALPRAPFFNRFKQEVIEERAKFIKNLLDYIAEHKMLFTSTEFVNFLQSGHPEPTEGTSGVINAIRSSLQLPVEDPPPLEYQSSDDDVSTPQNPPSQTHPIDDSTISRIPIFEAADVETRTFPKASPKLSKANSFESINSLESLTDDLYTELDKVEIGNRKPLVKKTVLPDLIIFDAPSTSSYDDYHRDSSETLSLNSDETSSLSSRELSGIRASLSKRECKTETEYSYVFEAGYLLNLAVHYDNMQEYHRAFDCYKAGIEKMLIGVQSDTNPQRRALIKEKTDTYLSYAEAVYKNHLCDAEPTVVAPLPPSAAPPLCLLRRPAGDLARFAALAPLAPALALVLSKDDNTCYAMKVIQKVPLNLTEFDRYFHQNTNETREPVLPTVVPYMVTLHSYIETNNLIFLILSYAPGEKLLDYIKNYAKSVPTTPAREVNLENVFSEPKAKRTDFDNDNIDSVIQIKPLDTNIELKLGIDEVDTRQKDENISIIDRIEANIQNNNKTEENKTETENKENLDNLDISVNELVINSQKLLLNVDKVLKEVPKDNVKNIDSRESDKSGGKSEIIDETSVKIDTSAIKSVRNNQQRIGVPRSIKSAVPAAAVRRWAAEILTAVDSLHNAGVTCRDLNPSNILLGSQGQVILTYFVYYPGLDMCLSKLHAARSAGRALYVAPELFERTMADDTECYDVTCDYWSFGAVMYELLCGVPLSYYHRSVFTSHTILHLPEGLSIDEQSLLTQLLTYDPMERLGANGIDEIKRHPYFRQVDWQLVHDTWAGPA